ncbi:MAG: DUF92 domain-containing protein [Calditrichaeota bacterium]|nr:MAG: DUF92 domain-containing protein [Calditrichota bacterium]
MILKDSTLFLLFTGAIIFTIVAAEIIRRLFHWPSESTRKLVHIFVGILVASTPFVLKSMWPMVIIGVSFTVIDYLAIRLGFLQGIHGTSRHTYGTVFYPISFVVLTISLWQNHKLILVTSMLIMAISDAAAAVVGERVKNPIILHWGPEKKSVQGSISMFVVTFLIVAVCLGSAIHLAVLALSPLYVLWIALVVALIAMMSEAISAQGSDNLTVPLSSAFTLYFMLTESTVSSAYFTLAVGLSLLFGLISYRLRFLDAGGSAALFLLGVLVFGVGSWAFTWPILTFFILSSILSKMGKRRKQKLETIFEKGSRRDAGQVLANGGVAGLMVIFYYFTDQHFFYILYIASLAAVTADTWATEIGVMAKGKPVSILNFRPVPLGTSGGISVLGTSGAFIGALLLVVVGYFSSPHLSPRVLGLFDASIILAAGLLASPVDSFLGATVQAQYQCPHCRKITEKRIHCADHQTTFVRGFRWINNDVVNAFCAFSSVLIVIIIARLLGRL